MQSQSQSVQQHPVQSAAANQPQSHQQTDHNKSQQILGARKRSELSQNQHLLQTSVINHTTGSQPPVLQQKRISGSQQQILAAIASKLHNKKQKHQQLSPSTGQHHKHLKVKETSQRLLTNTQRAAQSSSSQVVAVSGGAATNRTKQTTTQPHNKGKQSLNTELAALCSTKNDDGLKQALIQSSATKAKSGGVRNTNMVQGLVGTPSATQRVLTQQSALSNKKPQYVGKYQLQEIVGRGAFGRVYKGLNTQTSELVAIKMVPLIRLKIDCKKSIIDEINLMRHLDHKNIVKYIETVQSGHQLCIVMEFIEGGSLEYLYKKFGCFSETLVAIYIKQVLKGLEYLHRQTVIHRDIKGGNILTTKAGVVKLADFGVATKLTDAEKNNSFAGTPHWMAPEVIEMSGNVTSASDIWSVGCTVYELLKGSPPNFDLNKFCAMIKNVREPMPIPDVVSAELRDFLKKCFTKDPTKRPSATDLLEHAWFKKQLGGNKLARILEKQQLPQEVSNTIRVHLDSQDDEEESSEALKETEPSKRQQQATTKKTTSGDGTTSTQQKVKNVAKLLTRQNINMHQQLAAPTVAATTVSQPNLQVKQSATTERHLAKTASTHEQTSSYKHPIIYPTGGATSKNQATTVSLKKAIQDKLNAQALKSISTSTKVPASAVEMQQKSKSTMATKNHLMIQSALICQPQQPVIKESMTTVNRANSASQVKGLKPSLATTTMVGDKNVAMQQSVLAQKFYPTSATNQSLTQVGSDGAKIGGGRPQTSLAAHNTSKIAAQNSFLTGSGSKTAQGIQSTSQIVGTNLSGGHTGASAAQQRGASGGALFDLRGNKRLFHLSRKMIGNATQVSIPVIQANDIGRGSVDPNQTPGPPQQQPLLQNQNQYQAQQSSQVAFANPPSSMIPESQQVTEYSPDQDPRQQQSSSLAVMMKADATGTEERQPHQTHHVIVPTGRNGSRKPQLKHSLTEEQPNFLKQWTEQTELTANVVKQSSNNVALGQQSPRRHQDGQAVDESETLEGTQMGPGQPHLNSTAQLQGPTLQKPMVSYKDVMTFGLMAQEEAANQNGQSPLQKLAKHSHTEAGGDQQLSRKPNWPIKIYPSKEGGDQMHHHPQQKSLILSGESVDAVPQTCGNPRIQLNKSAEISSHQLAATTNLRQRQQLQLSSDFSENQNQLTNQHLLTKDNTAVSSAAISSKATNNNIMMGLEQPLLHHQYSMPPSHGSSHYQTMNRQQVLPAQQLNNPAVLTSTTPTHNFPAAPNQLSQSQKQQMLDLQNQQMSRSDEKTRVERPGRTAISSLSQNYPSNGGGVSRQRPATNHLQPLVPHQVSLTATGFHPHQVGPQTVSMAANGLSQHHPQHKSLQFGVGVMHTAKASQKQLRLRSPLGGALLQTAAAGGLQGHDYSHTIDVNATQQRDESDLGDLDDDDESRTLFQQFVQRTNLGLNRKPSNSNSLSGTSSLLPGAIKKTNTGSTKGLSSSKLQYDLKHSSRKAAEAGQRHGAEIKRQLFLIEIVKSGDTRLMQLIVDNSTHLCCVAASDDQGDDDDFESEDPSKHHSCERTQFRKSIEQLTSEVCQLLKQVANGAWHNIGVGGDSQAECEFQQQGKHVGDAFREAFLSQLSFFDLIQLLEWKTVSTTTTAMMGMVESETESVAYSALQVINQLSEGSVTIQRQFMTAGLIQKLKQFVQGEELREIKVEVAYFIGQVFQHSKELIAVYMGCHGFQIQLDFLLLSRQDQFRDNIDLVMIAIDSILVMFEEQSNQSQGKGPQAQATSQTQLNLSGKRASNFNGTLQAGMNDCDLAKILTQAGLLPLLTSQVPNFVQNALNSSGDTLDEKEHSLTYLERIFDILINLAICGQHMVRRELCSEAVLGANLTQFISSSLLHKTSKCSPIRLQVAKWYVKLIIALTAQQTLGTNGGNQGTATSDLMGVSQGASQIVIFELLGQRNTIALLGHLVLLFTYHQQSQTSGQPASSYLATLYETLKLLNLLCKMAPSRCEQACLQGNVVFGLKTLLATLEVVSPATEQVGGPQQQQNSSLTVSRSKKSRLTNTSLQLIHELVVASVATRTSLLDNGIPALLLQLYHLKASVPVVLGSSNHNQKQSLGKQQSLSLQSANSNLRVNLMSQQTTVQQGLNASQDQEIVGRILDIFVLWVQQDDQTGQVMQEILADQQSLEVIFSLIGQPRRHKAQALLSFFNALNRILLASDRVIEALLSHVHLIVHLSAILVFLSRQLSGGEGSSSRLMVVNEASVAGGLGQTGATPNSLKQNGGELLTGTGSEMLQQQAALAQQWQDCFKNGASAGGAQDDETSRVNNKSRDRKGSHNLLSEQQQYHTSLGTQQTTQILKELLEIFQLLVQAFQQVGGTIPSNFLTQLNLGLTIQQVHQIATDSNLVILQSMSGQLLNQIAELPTGYSAVTLNLENGPNANGYEVDGEVYDEDDHVSTEQEHYSASHSHTTATAMTKKSLTPNSAAMFQYHKQAIKTNFTSAASALRPNQLQQHQQLTMFNAPQQHQPIQHQHQQHHPQKMFKGGFPLKQSHPSKQHE